MTARATISVYEGQRLVYTCPFSDVVRIGRQSNREPHPYALVDTADGRKLIIASTTETTISRNQAVLELQANGLIRISNPNTAVPFVLDQGTVCGCETTNDHALPVVLVFDGRAVRVESSEDLSASEAELHTLGTPMLAPGQVRSNVPTLADLLVTDSNLSAERLTRWLLDTMAVFHRGQSAEDFLDHAAKALVSTLGLDFSAALRFENNTWNLVSQHGDLGQRHSDRILDRVRDEKRSFRQQPTGSQNSSLVNVSSATAVPLLDPDGDVIGALYGHRCRRPERDPVAISDLEAMVMELIASGVANGMAREEQEQAAAKARAQFESFFTPELARELERNPALLQGREAEVSLLFCDIHGFSTISDRIGPQQTMAWINATLETLSSCVVERGGVLVDYMGDALLAMWGAPRESPRHAIEACSAALEMQRRIQEINDQWGPTLGEPTAIGIGINSGTAHVGNTGSSRKFKYGPLGGAVNLASRVQGITKLLRVDTLVTESTAAGLDESFGKRCLCEVQVVNIPKPVKLFEIVAEPDNGWRDFAATYELALDEFRAKSFHKASELLGRVLSANPTDGPAITLLSRSANAMTKAPEPSHPVWILERK